MAKIKPKKKPTLANRKRKEKTGVQSQEVRVMGCHCTDNAETTSFRPKKNKKHRYRPHSDEPSMEDWPNSAVQRGVHVARVACREFTAWRCGCDVA